MPSSTRAAGLKARAGCVDVRESRTFLVHREDLLDMAENKICLFLPVNYCKISG